MSYQRLWSYKTRSDPMRTFVVGRSMVIFAGKKVPFARPRVRAEGKEVPLERLRLFQESGRMQEAATRQVTLGVSMRDYEKAVDGVCDGRRLDALTDRSAGTGQGPPVPRVQVSKVPGSSSRS